MERMKAGLRADEFMRQPARIPSGGGGVPPAPGGGGATYPGGSAPGRMYATGGGVPPLQTTELPPPVVRTSEINNQRVGGNNPGVVPPVIERDMGGNLRANSGPPVSGQPASGRPALAGPFGRTVDPNNVMGDWGARFPGIDFSGLPDSAEFDGDWAGYASAIRDWIDTQVGPIRGQARPGFRIGQQGSGIAGAVERFGRFGRG